MRNRNNLTDLYIYCFPNFPIFVFDIFIQIKILMLNWNLISVPTIGLDAPNHISSAIEIIKGKAMLILTRRIGETIIVGDDVNVIVLGVNGNQVRLGINAPKDTPVHREEIYNKIQNEKDNSQDH